MLWQQECWRGTRRCEGTQTGQLTPAGQRGIPYRMASCLVHKLGRKLGRGCCSGTGQASIGEWQAIALCITFFVYFFIIVIIFFGFPFIKLSSSQPTSFLTFILPHSAHWVSSQVMCSCHLGLNHSMHASSGPWGQDLCPQTHIFHTEHATEICTKHLLAEAWNLKECFPSSACTCILFVATTVVSA